ncbi:hypothetical protein Ahy_B05g078444 [Arachis hypogaea]|uniref:Uncharacterized protein n=1 Tax=Arachis hypogaea TaxID=3818 RepID=A0A444Z745_ARAHY|nr:hypothetical protein Ahy_B05g078444 [Arachis hypogaea]
MHGEERETESDKEKKRKGELPSNEEEEKREEDDGERSCHRHFLHLQHRLCLALLLLFLPCAARSATTLKLLLFSAILKSLTCTAVAISTCAAGSAAAVIPLFRLALPESSLVVIAARWLSSARQCLTSSLLCLSCLCCNPYCSLQSCLSLWLVQATAEAFRVADAPAKVFFLLMENTEEIFPFCAQIFQFQAQWLLVVAAEVISGYVILCLPFLYVLMFALYDHMLICSGTKPFHPTPAPMPTPLAGWMSNPTIVAHAAVSGGATIGLGTAIGLGAPSIHAALKDPRTPPTNPSVDYPSGDSNNVSKRTRPMGMSDEVNLPINVLSATFLGHGHGQAFNAPYDLPKTIMRTLNQDSSPMSMDFHPVQQTILLVGTNVGDIALWEVGSRECYICAIQAALVKDPGVSVNRVIWSPDGALFGVAYARYIVQIYSYHGGDEVRQHLEAFNAFGESCGSVILDAGVNII